MEFGILSLSDIQVDPETGQRHTASERIDQAVGYATLADRLGLDLFALGEHHTPDFAVSSPAVVLAAVAARTSRIRLASAVTVLPLHDPVRVYQDFAALDLLSHGRAEIIAGRSAFVEPFAMFGARLADYDALFEEKLLLLLQIREVDTVTWSGRFRTPLEDAPIIPRAQQQPLPVWIGVGGSPESLERAGRLGLPITLGYIGGSLAHLRQAVDLYRAAGERAGHLDTLRVGISTHFHAAETADSARATYPYYREYLRPKTPGGRGWDVMPDQFQAATARAGATFVGSSHELIEKILDAHDALHLDRFIAQIDWGGLPKALVEDSITRYATEIAPAIRSTISTHT